MTDSSKGKKRGRTMTGSRKKASERYNKKKPMLAFRMEPDEAQMVEELRAFYTARFREEGHFQPDEEASKTEVGRLAVRFLYEYIIIQLKKSGGGFEESRIPIEGQYTFIKPAENGLTDEGRAEMQEILSREDDNGKTRMFSQVDDDVFTDSEWNADRLVEVKKEVRK